MRKQKQQRKMGEREFGAGYTDVSEMPPLHRDTAFPRCDEAAHLA